MKTTMGWVAALVFSLLWVAFAIWVYSTDGALAFKIGAPILAVAFAVMAVLAYRRRKQLVPAE